MHYSKLVKKEGSTSGKVICNDLVEGEKFVSWQPSSWPEINNDLSSFWKDLEKIFNETILSEIENVISDAKIVNNGLSHRGHIVALALFCAIDTLSSYAYQNEKVIMCLACKRKDNIGPRYQKYIEEFFPNSYKSYASNLYKFYRNDLVHSWNLFEASILPGNESITKIHDNYLSFGLLNFFNALKESVKNFGDKFKTDEKLQKNSKKRYQQLRLSAKK